MPCKKCENGKYKWGNTGECKYATKEECEKSNPKKYSKMRPTPLGKKSYEEYEKELKEFNLSKVERVELGLVDDLAKILDGLKSFDKIIAREGQKAFNAYSEIQAQGNKLDEAYTEAFSFIDEANDEINKSVKLVEVIAKQARELGVNPKDIKGTTEVVKVVANLEDTINTLDKYESDFKKIINSL